MNPPFPVPPREQSLKPTITVIGVGGAGGNAVNNMIAAQLEGAKFVVANTDAQALDNALTDNVIQLGASITQGLGAGANPDVGSASAEEAAEELMKHIEGSHMVFITAGMGGGTGTGAAPVIARMAKEQGILTVSVVTKPFHFEGTHRMKLAENGLDELQRYVDTMIVIPNQNLFRIANDKTTFADAFRMADEVLHSGVRGVTDLMVMPGLINLDFSDIRTVMREMGKAMMGTGEAEGERRAIDASEAAISNPLLDDVSMKGARGVLINITGGYDMTLFEVDEAANRIRDEVDSDANIIFGSTFNEAMEGKMRVSVVATGIDSPRPTPKQEPRKENYSRGNITNNAGSPDTFQFKPTPFEGNAAQAAPLTSQQTQSRVVQSLAAISPTAATRTPQPQPQPVRRNVVARHSPTRAEIAPHTETHAEKSSEEAPAPAALVASSNNTAPAPATPAPTVTAPAASTSRPAQPVAPKLSPVAAAHHFASDAHAAPAIDEWEDDEMLEEDEQPGLFRRMTSKIASVRNDDYGHHDSYQTPPAAPQKRANIVTNNAPQPASNHAADELEIPAFLRRQVN